MMGLTTDEVFIVKPGGRRSGPHGASVQPKVTLIFDIDLDVENGDEVHRTLPNGKTEVFRVIESHFIRGPGDELSHWELKVAKGQPAPARSSTTVNIHNSTAFQVGDFNTINIQNAITELVGQIDRASGTELEKKEAKSLVARALQHPLVSAVLGSTAGHLIDLLKS